MPVDEIVDEIRLQYIANRINDEAYGTVLKRVQSLADKCRAAIDSSRRRSVLDSCILIHAEPQILHHSTAYVGTFLLPSLPLPSWFQNIRGRYAYPGEGDTPHARNVCLASLNGSLCS